MLSEGQPRLGIKGYPAEGGLYTSILESTGLYQETDDGWCFMSLEEESPDSRCLVPMWKKALEHIQENEDRTIAISELFGIWRQPPFGIKDGLMPILAVAFVLSQRERLAVYREGIFRARFDDVDVEYLAKDADCIQLRWMNLSGISRRLLSGMADIVRDLDSANTLVHLEPIDVARGLVAVFDQLPVWTKRTMRLSSNAVEIRNLFSRAQDPNKFLFDDIPATLGEDIRLTNDEGLRCVIGNVRDGLKELVQAYPSMLKRLRELMLSELQVPNISRQSVAELRDRAENIKQLAGDFRLDAFIGRLSKFDGSDESIEGIASLAANKPPRDWADPDLDQSAIEIADLAQRFIRAETYARVKGRPDKRQAMAIVIGIDGRPAPFLEEFDLADADRASVNHLIGRVTNTLEEADTSKRNVILAALAEITARYMRTSMPKKKNEKKKAAS